MNLSHEPQSIGATTKNGCGLAKIQGSTPSLNDTFAENALALSLF